MTNKEIARVLEEVGVLLVLTGENPFKSRAYERAAREIERSSLAVAELAREDRLSEVNGVGKGLEGKIKELVETGSMKYHADLRAKIAPGLFDLLKIPGLGPKRIQLIHDKLQIASVDELEAACQDGRLETLPGMGKKSCQAILDGIAQLRRHSGRFLSGVALPLADALVELLKQADGTQRVSLAGSIRRKRESVKDIDILIATGNPRAARDTFVEFAEVDTITADGDTKVSVVFHNGMNADLRILPLETWGAGLQHFTGSKDHNVKMRGLAKKKGYKISEWGIFKGENLLPCATEEEVYAHFDMPFIVPELREDSGEVEAALEGNLPDLIEPGDIRGILHVHTNWSDGRNTVEEMAQAAKDLGYEYLAICDHSATAAYANGLSEERLQRQGEEIEKVNNRMKDFRLLRGIELDILKDGSVDYNDTILEELDFVVASVHSLFRLTREEQTARIMRALENPHVDGIGHPTGQLILSRDGYDVDVDALIETAAKEGKWLELNADPHRLDLSWPWLKICRERGVKICINPDAHAVAGFHNMRFGIYEARRGWLTKDDVLNAGPWWKQ